MEGPCPMQLLPSFLERGARAIVGPTCGRGGRCRPMPMVWVVGGCSHGLFARRMCCALGGDQ